MKDLFTINDNFMLAARIADLEERVAALEAALVYKH